VSRRGLEWQVATWLKLVEYQAYRASKLRQQGGDAMALIAAYLVLMIVGDVIAFLVGKFVESQWPSASLPVFLAMYFIMLGVAWFVAVKITAPRAQAA